MMNPVRKQYEELGVAGYYQAHGADYANPHEPLVGAAIDQCLSRHPLDLGNVLDLACGTGEATVPLLARGAQVAGIDPYTAAAYARRTGRPAEELAFEQIAAGSLRGREYSAIVCSFALHLVEESRLPGLCWELSRLSPHLLLIAPHKKPAIDVAWGWRLLEERRLIAEFDNRLRARWRLYAGV